MVDKIIVSDHLHSSIRIIVLFFLNVVGRNVIITPPLHVIKLTKFDLWDAFREMLKILLKLITI